MPRPQTIHDFYGFPQELFDVSYPAPGLPELADEVAEVVGPAWVGHDYDSWGLDHGTWSVLCHAFPDADIPVVQLSINAYQPFGYHLGLGAKLAPLRERGVLVVGSGKSCTTWVASTGTCRTPDFRWAQRFDERAKSLMLGDPTGVAALDEHTDFDKAVPTPDHFIPLLYVAGLAGASGRPADVLVDGYAYGSLSMTAYTLDVSCPGAATDEGGAPKPPPGAPPADTTNI
jgi:4,5-DOPA dioxygenase extradiol